MTIQIIDKYSDKYKVYKTIVSASDELEIQHLMYLAKQEFDRVTRQAELFVSENDTVIDQAYSYIRE